MKFGALITMTLLAAACTTADAEPIEDSTSPTNPTETTTTAAPTTTTTAPPTTTSTLGDPWDDITVPVFGMDDGGQFRTSTFHVSFAYTVPAADTTTGISWERRIETAQFFVLGCNPPDENPAPCDGDIIGIDPGVSTVVEAVAVLTSNEALDYTEPVQTELAGASGVRFEVASDSQANAWEAPGGTGGIGIDETGFADVFIVQAGDHVAAFYVVAAFDGTFPESAQPILDSIVWKDLR